MRDTRCSKSACGTSPQIAGLPVPGPGSTGRPRAAAAPLVAGSPAVPGSPRLPGMTSALCRGMTVQLQAARAVSRPGRRRPDDPVSLFLRASRQLRCAAAPGAAQTPYPGPHAFPGRLPAAPRARSRRLPPRGRWPGRTGTSRAGASRAGASRAGPGRVRWVRARRPSAAFVSRVGQGHPAARGPGLAVAERGRPAHPHLHWDRPRLLLRHAAADHRGAALPGRTAWLDRDRARRPGNRSGLAQRPCARPVPGRLHHEAGRDDRPAAPQPARPHPPHRH